MLEVSLLFPMPEPTSDVSLGGQWSLVVGFLMPLLIAVIQQPAWKKDVKATVAFFACLCAAVVQLSIEGKLDFKHFMPTVVLTLVTAISTFQHFWKPTGIADAIEKGTSPGHAPEEKED